MSFERRMIECAEPHADHQPRTLGLNPLNDLAGEARAILEAPAVLPSPPDSPPSRQTRAAAPTVICWPSAPATQRVGDRQALAGGGAAERRAAGGGGAVDNGAEAVAVPTFVTDNHPFALQTSI